MPWYIGILIVLASVIYVGYEMVITCCATTTPIALGALFVIPAIYFGLMYLTLISPD
jgi:hypothetical protein